MSFNFETTYTTLPASFYREIGPNRVKEPCMLLWNERLAQQLNVDDERENVDLFTGSQQRDYIAQAYAGHQFGHFTMLGDGRAMLIGEHAYQQHRVDIQ